MPFISKANSELLNHVFMPIIEQIGGRILQSLDYSDKIGNEIYISTDWSTHSKTSDEIGDAKLSQQAFRIDANIQLNPMSQKFDTYTFAHSTAHGITNRTVNNTMHSYFDKENRVRVVEMRSPVTIVMNCELILESPELAFQTPQKIFNEHETGSVFHYNDLAFDYPIPKEILQVIYVIWKMDRIKGRPANVKFYDYLMRHSNGMWQIHEHKNKKQYEVVIPSVNLKTLGTLEYADDRPSGMMEGRTPVGFSIPFIYTTQFALPTLSILQFPPMVNNQLVPREYIPAEKTKRFNNMPEVSHFHAVGHYRDEFDPKHSSYIQLPEYDEWIVPFDAPVRIYEQTPVFISSVFVTEDADNYRTVLDFSKDLDEQISFHDIVKEFLYQQGAESVEYDCVYNVAMYKEDRQLVPYADYNFNDDLQCIFNAADLYSRYRVVVSAAINLDKINPKWYDLLKKYYPFLNPSIKFQIKNAIENGHWRDPSLPHVNVGDNGWIYDDRGKPLIHITDHKYPDRSTEYEFCPQTRVFRNIIIPKKAPKLTSGNSR